MNFYDQLKNHQLHPPPHRPPQLLELLLPHTPSAAVVVSKVLVDGCTKLAPHMCLGCGYQCAEHERTMHLDRPDHIRVSLEEQKKKQQEEERRSQLRRQEMASMVHQIESTQVVLDKIESAYYHQKNAIDRAEQSQSTIKLVMNGDVIRPFNFGLFLNGRPDNDSLGNATNPQNNASYVYQLDEASKKTLPNAFQFNGTTFSGQPHFGAREIEVYQL